MGHGMVSPLQMRALTGGFMMARVPVCRATRSAWVPRRTTAPSLTTVSTAALQALLSTLTTLSAAPALGRARALLRRPHSRCQPT